MEIEKIGNRIYYKYSKSQLEIRNNYLYNMIIEYSIKNDLSHLSFKETFYMFENNLVQKPFCYCGCDIKFVDMIKGFRKFCSKRCMMDSIDIKLKRRKSNMEKYGVDNPSKSDIIKDKVKKTNLNKFGVEYPLQSIDIRNKVKEINMEKYGVDNPSKLKVTRDKAKNTMVNKYGVEHAMHNYDIKENLKLYFMEKYGIDNPFRDREKIKNTMINRYGVEFALQNNNFLEKLKNTNIERYGVDSPNKLESFKNNIKYLNFKKYGVDNVMKLDYFKNKIKNVNMERYGFPNYSQSPKFKIDMKKISFDKNSFIVNDDNKTLLSFNESEYEINCKICGNIFFIQRQLYRVRTKLNDVICLKCNPINNGVSKLEKEVLIYVKEIYDGVILENFKSFKKYEIDIYLPELNIGFEFNGLYWHSELYKDKNYHLNKKLFFKENNIQLIQIWEDDWLFKKDIVKSMILNKLGKNTNRIYARKCIIKEITDNNIVKDFLNTNHIQGKINSSIKIGLFHKDELVSLMTFGSLRISVGQKHKDGSYELLRFCNVLSTSVIGGASKLFKYFIRNYAPKKIISYSLNTYSDGDIYRKMQFELISIGCPNYFWCKNNIRYHRFNFRKDKLVKDGYDVNKTEVDIMYDRKYFRVFDAGSSKYEFIFNI